MLPLDPKNLYRLPLGLKDFSSFSLLSKAFAKALFESYRITLITVAPDLPRLLLALKAFPRFSLELKSKVSAGSTFFPHILTELSGLHQHFTGSEDLPHVLSVHYNILYILRRVKALLQSLIGVFCLP